MKRIRAYHISEGDRLYPWGDPVPRHVLMPRSRFHRDFIPRPCVPKGRASAKAYETVQAFDAHRQANFARKRAESKAKARRI